MTKVIFGNELVNEWVFHPEDLKAVKGKTVVILKANDDPASDIYVRNKMRELNKFGICVNLLTFPNVPEIATQMIANITAASCRSDVIGIMCQLPFYPELDRDKQRILNAIPFDKDVDCLSARSLGVFYSDNFCPRESGVIPCPATPKAILNILLAVHQSEWYKGKKAVVIGRSALVGQPTAHLLGSKSYLNMTVSLVHSSTENIADYTRDADVIVVAVGIPKFLKGDMVKDGAIVIDVGINKVPERILPVGDADFENVAPKCEVITPVPNGVGPMTIRALMHNIIDCQGADSN